MHRRFCRNRLSTATGRLAAITGRGGLAPVELILGLPLLLMLLAMMIIVGTAGAWKVRTLANSRQAAARALWPRDGADDPKPDSWWPDSATMSAGSADPDPFGYDPFAEHVFVRGPRIGGPGVFGLGVDHRCLDITRGLFAGHAAIDRDFPLWRQLPYRNKYHRETQVFSGDHWQFQTMGMGDNVWRRVDLLYDYNLASRSPTGLGRTNAALQALRANRDRPLLFILDRDDELRTFYGDPYDANWYERYDRFNFHPPAYNSCTLNLRPDVDNLVDRIEEVPCQLARAFRTMYEEQRWLAGNANTAALDQKIRQLDQFLQRSCSN